MKKRQTVSALLLLAALCSALVSCGGGDTDGVSTKAPDAPSSQAEEATTGLADIYGIVSADMGGEELVLLTGEHAEYEYMIEKETGDIVEDAVYFRNRAVEELLNVSLSFVSEANWKNSDPFYRTIRTDIMAGDSSYDIINGLNVYTTCLIFDDLFMRLDDIDTIDFSHPWWVPGLSLNGSDEVYFAFTDASLSLYKDLYVIFFNQSMIQTNGLENPYDHVKNNTWTIDNFMKIASQGSRDINGDGKIEEEIDQLAYVAKHAANRSFMTSTETSLFVRDSNGRPILEGVSERLTNVYEKMKPFLSDRTLTFVTTEPDMIALAKPFIEERTLFMSNCLIAVEGMRDMENDYGIVPFPKYDETQENYHTQIATSTSAIYLPTTAENPEMLGTVLEALGFYSWRDVVPTYYEIALGDKYARDETVVQMLDFVRASASTNIDFAYGAIFNTYDIMNAAWEKKELASWYAGSEKSVLKKLDEYLD